MKADDVEDGALIVHRASARVAVVIKHVRRCEAHSSLMLGCYGMNDHRYVPTGTLLVEFDHGEGANLDDDSLVAWRLMTATERMSGIVCEFY